MPDNGFIEDYRDFILDAIPTSTFWAESVATSIMSVGIGKEKRVVTRRGELKLNPWFIYVGTSGIANKTTPLKYFASPMIEILEDMLSPEDGPRTSLLFPPRFTIEGMIEYMSKHSYEGIIIRDEFTSAFKDMNKDYMADFTEFMSEIYDGTAQKRYTRSAKLEQTKPVFVNFLAATTPFLYTILKLDFFLQGMGNRLLFIVDSIENRRVELEDFNNFFQNSTQLIQSRQNRFESYASELLQIRDTPIRYICPLEDAGNLILQYKYEVETELVRRNKANVYDIYAPYMARLPEAVYKLTALHTVSREYLNLTNLNSDIALSNAEDALWAINKVKTHFEHFKTMVSLWRSRPEPAIVRTLDEQIGTLLDLLSDKDRGLSWSEIRNKLHWDIRIYDEVLHQLFDTGRVCFVLRRPEGAGRPSVILCQTQHLRTSTSNGEQKIEDWNLVKIKLNFR